MKKYYSKYFSTKILILLIAVSTTTITACEGKVNQKGISSNVIMASLITRCVKKTLPTSVPIPEATTPISLNIAVVPDPSLDLIDKKDPYAQISEPILEAYKINKELYNNLFNAVDKMETTVDVSKFTLSALQKEDTINGLIEQTGLQFYYVNKLKLSKDCKSVLITYTDKGGKATNNKKLFYSKLNNLIYNVAPDDYSPLQKLFSVYNYITVHSGYTDNMLDYTTFTPYSILMKGKGICGGYAILGCYVLNRVGIKTKVMTNEAHAWNMVNIDGKNYHTDITFGAGFYNTSINQLNTILMDDDERNLTLDNAGHGGSPIIEGYPREVPKKPLPAPDKRFKVYYNIYNDYAFDIENNLVFYSNKEGIKSMNLEGTKLKTISPLIGTSLITFKGTLYFINTNTRHLYKIQPNKQAELLDGSVVVESMDLTDGILRYKYYNNGPKEKTINLDPPTKSNFDIVSSKHQQTVTVPLPQTFKFNIEFSKDMKTDILPKEAVTLVNKEGKDLPIHMNWNKNGRILTVRSQVSLENESSVSLYVSPGITAANGKKSADHYDIKVNLQ